MTIEVALPDDGAAVWEFLQRFAMSYLPSRKAFERDYPRLLESEDSDLLIAHSADKAVGYLLAHRNVMLFAGGPILEIAELYVEETRRGEGIGRALVLAALDRAWAAGCVEAVVPTRRAQGFYETLGFGASATYLRIGRHPCTDNM
jgi:GNAT superfamily N-acetyltransferase